MAVTLTDDSFDSGSLQRISYVRPGKLFTANLSLMQSQVGCLKGEVLGDIIGVLVQLFQASLA